jgi:thiamine biosynthesis protein ThiS
LSSTAKIAMSRPQRWAPRWRRSTSAINGEFVPARAREATPLKDGDRIEIVAPRQGG